jgi:hypothetical protein
VEYQATKTNRVMVAELQIQNQKQPGNNKSGLLLVSGAIENVPTCKAVLRTLAKPKSLAASSALAARS